MNAMRLVVIDSASVNLPVTLPVIAQAEEPIFWVVTLSAVRTEQIAGPVGSLPVVGV
jgi:hypothetical protein